MKEKLMLVQEELKAPKNQRNNFGNYNYRSCEDILEAVKPLLKKNRLVMNISDEITNVGERYYIKATAILTDIDSGEHIENTAYAREEETKKGMDGSQITGASSSYARKYALNGLFLIDDVKDSDSTNTGEEVTKEYAENYVFTFGKYKDKKLKDVCESDMKYIDWLLKNEGTSQDIIKSIELLTGLKPIETDDEKVKLTNRMLELVNLTGTEMEDIEAFFKKTKGQTFTKEETIRAIEILEKKAEKGVK